MIFDKKYSLKEVGKEVGNERQAVILDGLPSR